MSDFDLDVAMAAFMPEPLTSDYQLIEVGQDTPPLDLGVKHLFIDAETEPLSPEELLAIVPPYKHKAKAHPGEFDPESVKYGNTKAADKRAAKLASAKERHAKLVKEWENDERNSEIEYWDSVLEAATLNATRSRVCTIQVGVADPAVPVAILHGPDEALLIQAFWDILENAFQKGRFIYGFSIFNFDFPYLIRRSIINGIRWPSWLISVTGSGYINWNQNLFDLQKAWSLGQKSFITLDELGAALGCGTKRDLECDGERFHEMWNDESRRHSAITYAVNDVVMLIRIAEVMGHVTT